MTLKFALVLGVLGGIVLMDCGPLAAPAIAQRSGDDEGRRDDVNRGRREGRGGWGRYRGNDDDERRDGERRRDRGNEANRDRENRDENSGPRMDYSEYARGLVKKYDKNGNMMLEEDERGQLTGPVARADLDNDKVITVEEIVARLSNRESPQQVDSERRSEGDDSKGSGDRASASSPTAKTRVFTSVAAGSGSAKEADKRRSYRFKPATERLTGDLPSWFKSRDRNADGQVAMSEYSRSWSERLVREFQRYDRNDDGVITPKEAAQK